MVFWLRSLFPMFIILVLMSKDVFLKGNKTSSTYDSVKITKKNHLMLSRSANATCDLTEGVCDYFCCSDPDCDDWQKKTFDCPADASDKGCEQSLSQFNCRCNISSNTKPEWFSFFCWEYGNPIYLGKFFEIPNHIENIRTFNSYIKKKRHNPYGLNLKSFRSIDMGKRKSNYHLGSPIKIYTQENDSFKLPKIGTLLRKDPVMNLNQACLMSPEKFRINKKSSCTLQITKELCENAQTLGILPQLIQDEDNILHSNAPYVLKSLDFLQGSQIKSTINCVTMKVHLLKIGQRQIVLQQSQDVRPCSSYTDKYHTYWTNDTCHNVLINTELNFIVNGTDILKVVAEYNIGNVLFIKSNTSYLPVYIKQKLNTTFTELIYNHSSVSFDSSKHHLYLNRGYAIGEKLKFGFKTFEESTPIWEDGALAIFKNGGSCDDLIDVAFGYDYLSRCRMVAKFTTCEELGNKTDEIFDRLLRGNHLASYHNLRNSSEETVPLLRNYSAGGWSEPNNSTQCVIRHHQDITIQYTSVYTEAGYSIYRIIGLKEDRVAKNTSLEKFEGYLTSRVVFLYVSSEPMKRRSRFWERMLSPELSENSWLNILNAFEGVGDVENTFWCLGFVAGTSAVFAVTKLNANHGEPFLQNLRPFGRLPFYCTALVAFLSGFIYRSDGVLKSATRIRY